MTVRCEKCQAEETFPDIYGDALVALAADKGWEVPRIQVAFAGFVDEGLKAVPVLSICPNCRNAEAPATSE
jgi:hypothetical protein